MAAEQGIVDLVAAVVEPASAESSHPANSNAPRARGTGEHESAPAQRSESAAVALPEELVSLANEIGAAWSRAYVQTLEEQERDIVGAWPGTIREARRHLIARIKTKLEPEQLDQLARLTNLAARRGWETVSEPDLES